MIPGWSSIAPDSIEIVDIPLPEPHIASFGAGERETEPWGLGWQYSMAFGNLDVVYEQDTYGRSWAYHLRQHEVFGVVLLDSLDVPEVSLLFEECGVLPEGAYDNCGVVPAGAYAECAPAVAGAFAGCAPVPNGTFGDCGPDPDGTFDSCGPVPGEG